MIYNNLIYNNTIINQFRGHVDTNSIPNAFIFYGNEGAGKFGHAIELSYMILSKNSSNKSNTLNKIKKNVHENINYILPLPKRKAIRKSDSALKALKETDIEDIHEQIKAKLSAPYQRIGIEKANTILINSIRDIKNKIHLSDYNNQWNIYIIMNAEKLCIPRAESANALLKILEEPNEKNLFILITSNIAQMLDTITSRCTKIFFPKIKKNKITKYLKEQTNNFNEDFEIASSLCNGNITSCLELINEFETRFSIFDEVIKLLFENNLNKWNNFSKKIKINELKHLLDLLIIFFSDIIIYKEQLLEEKLNFQNHSNQIIILSKKYDVKVFQSLINIINNTKRDIGKNVFSPLLLTSLYIEINQVLKNTSFNKVTFDTLNVYL